MNELVLRPPKPFNALRALISAAVAVGAGFWLTFVYSLPLDGAWRKAGAFTGFLFGVILLIAASGTAVFSLLNVFSAPTVRLSDDSITVLNSAPIPLSDISSYSLDDGRKNLTLTCADGAQTVIKLRFINISLLELCGPNNANASLFCK